MKVKMQGGLEQVPSVSELSLSDSSGDGSRAMLKDEGSLVWEKGSSIEAGHTSSVQRYIPNSASSLVSCHSPAACDHFGFDGYVIGPTNLAELAVCPCCAQCFDEAQPDTLNEPPTTPRLSFSATHSRSKSIFAESDDEIEDEDEDILPGVLPSGVHYNPKKVIVEGWLHKKGTGKDWIGSRSWKARWSRLVLAKVDGYDYDVPLMLIYWYPTSAQASTVIILDSTVVMPVDQTDKSKWNSYRFEIRHIPKGQSNETLATRTFTAQKESRDAWVYAISQALLSYEKRKDKSRKQASKQASLHAASRSHSPDRSRSPTYEEIWTGEHFVSSTSTPPRSPVSPSSPVQVGSPGTRHSFTHPASPPIPRPVARRPGGLSNPHRRGSTGMVKAMPRPTGRQGAAATPMGAKESS